LAWQSSRTEPNRKCVESHEEQTEGLGHLLNAQARGGSHQDVDPGYQP
jgi:hypothetical protein